MILLVVRDRVKVFQMPAIVAKLHVSDSYITAIVAKLHASDSYIT